MRGLHDGTLEWQRVRPAVPRRRGDLSTDEHKRKAHPLDCRVIVRQCLRHQLLLPPARSRCCASGLGGGGCGADGSGCCRGCRHGRPGLCAAHQQSHQLAGEGLGGVAREQVTVQPVEGTGGTTRGNRAERYGKAGACTRRGRGRAGALVASPGSRSLSNLRGRGEGRTGGQEGKMSL